jgi:hypothetical protein
MIRLVFLGLMTAAYAVVCFVSPHPFWMLDTPHIEQLASFPRGEDAWQISQPLNTSGTIIPVKRLDQPFYPEGVRIGYAYRTFSALKLPFVVYSDPGPVIYTESSSETRLTPLDEETHKYVTQKLGHDPLAGHGLPYLQYLWGWLFVVALLIWLFFQYRYEARKREESGLL